MPQSGKILSFLRTKSSLDWTQQELAEFYRVESALLQHGLLVSTDRGFSDEGDPWFVFCRSDNEEVIAHFARIDGRYLVISNAFSGVACGRDFKLLIRELMDAHPLMLPRNHGSGQKVFLHPAALLAALLAASYLVSSDKDAGLQDVSGPGHEKGTGFWLNFRNEFAILSAVAAAAVWIEHSLDSSSEHGLNFTALHDAGEYGSLHGGSHFLDHVALELPAPSFLEEGKPPHGDLGEKNFALDQGSAATEAAYVRPSHVPQLQGGSGNGSDATLNVAASGDPTGGGNHADTGKAGAGVLALNEGDSSAPAFVDSNAGTDIRHSHGSGASLGSYVLSPNPVPTGTAPAAVNNGMDVNHDNLSVPVVLSTNIASSQDIATSLVTGSGTSSSQISADGSAATTSSAPTQPLTEAPPVTTSTSALDTSATTTVAAHSSAATSQAVVNHIADAMSVIAHATPEPMIVGVVWHTITAHHFDAS